MQPVLPDGWFLMEQLRGPSYYWHESGTSQFVPPKAPNAPAKDWPPTHSFAPKPPKPLPLPDEESDEEPYDPCPPAFGWGTVSAYDNYY